MRSGIKVSHDLPERKQLETEEGEGRTNTYWNDASTLLLALESSRNMQELGEIGERNLVSPHILYLDISKHSQIISPFQCSHNLFLPPTKNKPNPGLVSSPALDSSLSSSSLYLPEFPLPSLTFLPSQHSSVQHHLPPHPLRFLPPHPDPCSGEDLQEDLHRQRSS